MNRMVDGDTGDGVARPPQAAVLSTTQRFLRINRRDISYLRFILEGYDGIAVLTTWDAARGIVRITIAPGCETLVDEIIASLSRAEAIMMEPLPAKASMVGAQ